MTEATTAHGFSADALDALLQSHHIKLSHQQRRRLQWLGTRFGTPVVWDRPDVAIGDSKLIIVLEPPSGPRAELFYRALHAGCIVVIPFGENPGFDFLKSKLTDFGTIGALGAQGPHELWWGGVNWATIMPLAGERPLPRVASCYARDLGKDHIRPLARSLTALGLDFDIEVIDAAAPGRLHGFEKAEFILKMWRKHNRPLLWVDADAELMELPQLPASLDCDFAVHKWNRWEMSSRTLYFGRSPAAEAMLKTWHNIAASYPAVWDGYALDQAWSLVSSQMSLDTVWLPRAYHGLRGDQEPRRRPAIVHALDATTTDLGPDPSFPKALQTARRACRTGAPESLVVMTAPAQASQPVTVILRDIQSAGARTVAASVEAVTQAFNDDPAGFSHLELSLCPWQDDVKAATSVATSANHRVLELAPSASVSGNLFRRLADSAGKPARGHVVALTPRRPADGPDLPFQT